ncbi:hypothetical protein S7711_05806 [Stachybotrys chartarum IBT 7711]|uniref:Pectate lyase n=1 Tax=Stachybotrys chartarum (strain CBS 109288 / IBT 7711) TaxID=1280523 RepID=A0A084AM44_STACB|nr:hypothetical protein S7711_05806 [Stachybotrys chartarum IBT 7711]
MHCPTPAPQAPLHPSIGPGCYRHPCLSLFRLPGGHSLPGLLRRSSQHTGTKTLGSPQTIKKGVVFDAGWVKYDRGVKCTDDSEGGSADAVFILEEGLALRNFLTRKKRRQKRTPHYTFAPAISNTKDGRATRLPLLPNESQEAFTIVRAIDSRYANGIRVCLPVSLPIRLSGYLPLASLHT